jgi:hypothetical protein
MGDDFDLLCVAIRRAFPDSEFGPVPEAELAAIRWRNPGVPDHYFEFLRQVGAGRLGNRDFMIYSGLCEPDEVFDAETAASLAGVLFFGDDYSGWMVGFDTRNDWQLVGVDSTSPLPVPEKARTVGDFLALRVAGHERA